VIHRFAYTTKVPECNLCPMVVDSVTKTSSGKKAVFENQQGSWSPIFLESVTVVESFTNQPTSAKDLNSGQVVLDHRHQSVLLSRTSQTFPSFQNSHRPLLSQSHHIRIRFAYNHGICNLSNQSYGSNHWWCFRCRLCFCSAVPEVWYECCSRG